SFEKQLAEDGCVIIKLLLYISQKEQKKRFEKLTENKETKWRVSDGDWKRNKEYEKYLMMNEEMLEHTDTGYARWTIIEATDKNYAAMKILATVADRMEYE
ncbi:phosphate--AMP phosphotransferase, partial [[Clostridium] symbiosum]|nr:phosphate--AMP phosphotransferase [[Clostridium] symbiosum]